LSPKPPSASSGPGVARGSEEESGDAGGVVLRVGDVGSRPRAVVSTPAKPKVPLVRNGASKEAGHEHRVSSCRSNVSQSDFHESVPW
jgi:hypothetical protein